MIDVSHTCGVVRFDQNRLVGDFLERAKSEVNRFQFQMVYVGFLFVVAPMTVYGLFEI